MTSQVLYVGTHRKAHRADPSDSAFGVYRFRFNLSDGSLQEAGLSETEQPGWIAFHPNKELAYIANEVDQFEGSSGGGISAFAIDAQSGSLALLNQLRLPSKPCHCVVDGSGQYLLVATYEGGTIHLIRLRSSDGGIDLEADRLQFKGSSTHLYRQTKPHPHAVVIDPEGQFVLVPDLGTDQVMVLKFDRIAGKLLPRREQNIRLPAGSGPRHMIFDRAGKFSYLLSEMSATLSVFSYDADSGSLRQIQTLDLLPNGFTGLRSGAEIAIDPTGRFLYATTRSHGSSGEPQIRGLDSIVWLEIDERRGTLCLQGRVHSGGEIPRSFTFDPTGTRILVGHQCSGTIVTFEIDRETGAPLPSGPPVSTPVPVCLRFSNLRT